MKQRVESLLKKQAKNPAPDGVFSGIVKEKPADGTSGYAKSCMLQDYVAGVVYVNEGTLASCDFKTVTTE